MAARPTWASPQLYCTLMFVEGRSCPAIGHVGRRDAGTVIGRNRGSSRLTPQRTASSLDDLVGAGDEGRGPDYPRADIVAGFRRVRTTPGANSTPLIRAAGMSFPGAAARVTRCSPQAASGRTQRGTITGAPAG